MWSYVPRPVSITTMLPRGSTFLSLGTNITAAVGKGEHGLNDSTPMQTVLQTYPMCIFKVLGHSTQVGIAL